MCPKQYLISFQQHLGTLSLANLESLSSIESLEIYDFMIPRLHLMESPLDTFSIPRPAQNFFACLEQVARTSNPVQFLFFCLEQMYTLSQTMRCLQKIELSFPESRDYLELEFHVVRNSRSGVVERIILSNWESEGVLYWPYIKGTRCRYITSANGTIDYLNPSSRVQDQDLETYSDMGDEYGFEGDGDGDEHVHKSGGSDGSSDRSQL
jgi:hypothetical protein